MIAPQTVLGIVLNRQALNGLALLCALFAVFAVLMIMRADGFGQVVVLAIGATVATVFATAFSAVAARAK